MNHEHCNNIFLSALSITDVRQVCDPEFHGSYSRPGTRATTRPPTRAAARRPSTTPLRTRPSVTSRPHTVGATRTKTWHYGRPPPPEAHAPVIDWNKARQIRAPIVTRRAVRASETRGQQKTEVSVLQPYPMNYNAFLVQSLRKDLDALYRSPTPVLTNSKGSSGSEDEGSIEEFWKMT